MTDGIPSECTAAHNSFKGISSSDSLAITNARFSLFSRFSVFFGKLNTIFIRDAYPSN
jgi:hypothetical protein